MMKQDPRHITEINTKRVCELNEGDYFRWLQSDYMVMKVTDKIYFRLICDVGTFGGDLHSFGLHNQSRVEVIEKPSTRTL